MRAFLAVTAVSLLLLGGCMATRSNYGGYGGYDNAPSPTQGTNAPAAGFGNVVAGSEEDFILNVGRRVFFAENSAALDETSKVTLDEQAAWLNSHPVWLVKLQGFSDDPGAPADNVSISQARADAVMNYLVSRGVAANRMWAKGYGRDRIVRDCPEERCLSQNRRVITNLREEFDAAAPQARS